MRRVHGTFDLLEAHIIAQSLRYEGIAAWVFDADFVRQDWFKAIAYGGYRVMVADTDVLAAQQHITDYLRGALALPVEKCEAEFCTNCATDILTEDSRLRRLVFALLMFLGFFNLAIFYGFYALADSFLLPTIVILCCGLVLPLIGLILLRRRMRCQHCGYAAFSRRQPWNALSRSAIDQ